MIGGPLQVVSALKPLTRPPPAQRKLPPVLPPTPQPPGHLLDTPGLDDCHRNSPPKAPAHLLLTNYHFPGLPNTLWMLFNPLLQVISLESTSHARL